MGCLLEIIGSVLALVLGVVVFFGFLFLLLLNNVSDKMLSSDFYIDTIAGENTYERVYTDVLLDEDLLSTTQDLLGGVEVVTQLEIISLLRKIVPPPWGPAVRDGSHVIQDPEPATTHSVLPARHPTSGEDPVIGLSIHRALLLSRWLPAAALQRIRPPRHAIQPRYGVCRPLLPR